MREQMSWLRPGRGSSGGLLRPSEVGVPLAESPARRTFVLSVRNSSRGTASAPNRSRLEKVAGDNTRRAVSKRSTIFVRQLVHQSEGATIARVESRCREAEYRVGESYGRTERNPSPFRLYMPSILRGPHGGT